MTYNGRTAFRTTRGTLVFFVMLALVVFIVAVVSTYAKKPAWIQATCWLVFVGMLVAILDVVLSYVTLSDTEIRMRRNFRTTVVERDAIESVSVAKGCPIRLHLKDASRIEVPDLGVRGLDNSIRSWIRATPT